MKRGLTVLSRLLNRRNIETPESVVGIQADSNTTQSSVSVVMITHNHEKYITEALESVLSQTFADFDFVIINDGSTDRTDAIIRKYTDRRIAYFAQANQGVSAALNNGIAKAKGHYVAIMSGDDVCYPHRLQRQLEFLLSNNARAVTSWIDLIDDDSKPLQDSPDLLALCNCRPAQSRAEIVRKLWTGNFLWPSSAMIDTELFWGVGGFCLTSLQLQDWLLWIQIVKRTHIYTLTEPLIKYRIRAGGENLSRKQQNAHRTRFETKQIYRRFFDDLPVGIFREAFADLIRDSGFSREGEYAIEQAFLYLTHPEVIVREICVERLFDLMQNPQVVSLLAEKYNFSLPEFYRLENDPAYQLAAMGSPWSTS